MIQGKILKGISGFYDVFIGSGNLNMEEIICCKAKGIFRKLGMKPLVGDDVELVITDPEKREGSIERILPRRSELFRPAVANVDQSLLIFSIRKPQLSENLLDRFLLETKKENIPALICFNKTDLSDEEEEERLRRIYENSGAKLLFTCGATGEGRDLVYEALLGRITTVAGPSGAGKSTLINLLAPDAAMETGSLSEKIGRGKHTTRHTELFFVAKDTYILDTPGFGSLELARISPEELKDYYPEFEPYEKQCRFPLCSHVGEKECGVRAAAEEGKIPKTRYENYRLFYSELKERKNYG